MTAAIDFERVSRIPHTARRPRHLIVLVCFVAVVLSLASAAVTAQLKTTAADAPMDQVAAEAMPALGHLTAARTALHVCEALVQEAIEGRPWGRGTLQQARATLEREWAAYRGTRSWDGDADAVDRSLKELDGVLETVRQRLLAGEVEIARVLVHGRFESAMAAADRGLDHTSADVVAKAARVIRETHAEREGAARTGIVLDVVAAALVLVVAFIGLVIVRRYEHGIEARTAELEVFADRVAHDIRSPLTPAVVALELVERQSSDEALRRAALRGRRSLRTVTELVTDLHAFARSALPPDGQGSAPVRDVLDDVLAELRELATTSGVTLEVAPFEECAVACGRGVLASIASNLVRNAVLHMGDASRRRVVVTVRVAQQVRIDVADTGPGISHAKTGTIFEPHVRRHDGSGLGLGLATVRRLVEAHGGSVSVESVLGRGSTFSVLLPRP